MPIGRGIDWARTPNLQGSHWVDNRCLILMTAITWEFCQILNWQFSIVFYQLLLVSNISIFHQLSSSLAKICFTTINGYMCVRRPCVYMPVLLYITLVTFTIETILISSGHKMVDK